MSVVSYTHLCVCVLSGAQSLQSCLYCLDWMEHAHVCICCLWSVLIYTPVCVCLDWNTIIAVMSILSGLESMSMHMSVSVVWSVIHTSVCVCVCCLEHNHCSHVYCLDWMEHAHTSVSVTVLGQYITCLCECIDWSTINTVMSV